jgi:hypothetical protein
MEDVERIQRPSGARIATVRTRRRRMRNSSTSYLRLLVERLMDSENAQRPALCRELGLSRQLVSDLLAMLEIRGLVQVAGTFDGLPGRSKQSYALLANAALALAFELDGNTLSGTLCDMCGNIVAERTEPRGDAKAEGQLAQIATMANALCKDANLPRLHVRHTVIGMPGGNDLVSPDELNGAVLGCTASLSAAGLTEALEASRQRMLEQLFGAIPTD